MPKPVVVLESTNPPDGTTRYIDQVVTDAGDRFEFRYATPLTLLRGRYDVFHVHWPEVLVRSRRRPVAVARCLLLIAFLIRLRLTRVPVVRTVHNLDAHEPGSRLEAFALRFLDRSTSYWVTINPVTRRPEGSDGSYIPHGHYRDRFAGYARSDVVPGRLLYAGLIRPYKGVEQLLDVFARLPDGHTLRVVGRPTPGLRTVVERATAADPRVTARLEFVPDADFVAELSAAELVCLPYSELHNSGILLVALSLDRPVLVPDTATTRALAAEVGEGWVHRFSGELTPDDVVTTLARLRSDPPADRPHLDGRDWPRVAGAYGDAFLAALAGRRANRPAGARRPVPVFAWSTGQDFNIGDSLLRRPYLEQLADLGPVDAWVKGASAGYLTGLGTDHLARVSHSFPRWYARLVGSALRRKTVVAFNAGEMRVGRSRAALVLTLGLAAAVARVRGGASVWIGASVQPTDDPLLRWIYRFVSRRLTYVRWREAGSQQTAVPRAVGPDWGFATGTPTQEWPTAPRDVAAFVLRGDRPEPSAAWLAWWREILERNGLRAVVVVQVDIDTPRAHAVAAQLGGEVVTWETGVPHDEQEATVRAAYRRARIAVGDRLHGLVVAATEGAVPIGWVESSRGKIGSHFDAAGLRYVGEHEGLGVADVLGDTEVLSPERIAALAAALPGEIDRLRAELESTRVVLADLHAGGDRRSATAQDALDRVAREQAAEADEQRSDARHPAGGDQPPHDLAGTPERPDGDGVA